MLSRLVVKSIVELAHIQGIVPVLYVAMRDRQGYKTGAEWWWMGVAFSVSFVADSAAHWVSPLLVSLVYPLSQAALFGAIVILDVKKKWGFLMLLLLAGLFSVLARGVLKPDYILTTVAFGGLSIVLYPLRSLGVLRLALLGYFGLGVAYWGLYCAWPSTTSYLLFQGSRLLGISLFCYAASRPVRSHLRLIVPSRAA